MNFDELRKFYTENYTIGFLNPENKDGHTSFERKLILISLICYLYQKNKAKNPDLTYYSLIYKLSQGMNLPDKFLKGLAIVCEDFSYGCYEFPTFGLEGKNIISEIRETLDSYIPF